MEDTRLEWGYGHDTDAERVLFGLLDLKQVDLRPSHYPYSLYSQRRTQRKQRKTALGQIHLSQTYLENTSKAE